MCWVLPISAEKSNNYVCIMNKYITMLERASYGNIDLLVPPLKGTSAAISRRQVCAKFEPEKFARKTSEDTEKKIVSEWQNKCFDNPHLYNGSKFRLAGWEEQQQRLVLHLGLTCYRDLCGTNLAPDFHHLQKQGLKDFGNEQAYMSDPIGVGLLAVTSEGCLVVTRRAHWTGEYPGALDRPGGHPEPDHIFLPDGSLKPEHCASDVAKVVLREVWESAGQEAMNELGVSEEHIGEVTLLGIAFNMEAGGRPSLEFFARLGVDSEQVKATYRLGTQAEADESCSIHLLPPRTLALLPRLLPHPAPAPAECITKAGEAQGQLVDDPYLKEARWLLQEATPALKGALLLARHHNLLPLTS